MSGGLGRNIATGGAGLVGLVVLVAGAAAGALGANVGGLGANGSPSATALGAVPAGYLALYQQAAATCLGVPWSVLAAVGTIESGNGANDGPSPAGAVGPMQFEPATFAQYDQPVPPGGADPPSPYDPADAIDAAARLLCANGASRGADLPGAIYAYNHDPAYVAEVLDLASRYAQAATPAAVAVDYAISQLCTPYRWGGESPGVAFDCSGLVQAAYAASGVSLPRTAQAQYDTGPRVPPSTPLEPGDLVFFGSGTTHVTHVGIVVDPSGQMIDAPDTGAVVRVEDLPTTVGAPWGTDQYLGATRPG
jgi:cell wall-associated NlpC family hydrolase